MVTVHGARVRWAIAAPGFADTQVEVTGTTLAVELRRAPVTLRGKVHGADGAGLSHALIEIDPPKRAVRSDPDGSFELRDLPSSFPFELRASAPGLGAIVRRVVDAAAALRLDLVPPREVAGVVRDHDGKPIAAAQATLLAAGQSFEAFSGDDGTFVIPGVPAGSYDLRVDAKGFATGYLRVAVPAGRGTFDLPVTSLALAIELQGHVEDRQGHPVADVEVFVRRVGQRLDRGGLPPGEPAARSEADGSFVLAKLDGGASAKLLLWHRGYRPLEVQLKPDERERTFVLETASSLTLRVRRPDGSAAAGVSVRGMRPAFAGSSDFPRTNDEGELTFDGLDASSHRVAIDGGDGTYWEGVVKVPPPPSETTVEVLLRQPHVLAGTVADSDGTPIAGAKVEAPGSGEAIDTTNAAGEFNLDGLLDFPALVEVTHPRYAPAHLQVSLAEADAGSLRIVLDDRSTLVRGRVEGEEVAGLRLRWVHESSHRALTVTTQTDGSFEVGRLDPGRYLLALDDSTLVIEPARSVVVVEATAPEQYVVVPLVKSRP